MEPKENFKQRLLGLQGNLFSFAFQLTSNKEEAEDLLQDTTLKALTNEEKFAEVNTLLPKQDCYIIDEY